MLAVLGFALRNIFSDVFAGIALGLEHPFGIGGWIETTDGRVGRVVGISWRATRLVTREGTVVTVPNGQVAGNRLINYGSAAAGRYMASLRFALESDIPVGRAKRILLAAALEAGRDWPDLDPEVLLHDTADGAAIYAVRFHVPG
ncbi:mechanosensitive ion channel domain-containing protein [Roseomonas sp. HF4]|uniref:mechanosensitive ion channel domain-containing protein n=1 Tax=Roseomonas sp. HF4 TaxID=2562313 RepID=UPI0014850D12|nr:mechanosensitive ion channel domain-containing protein [Roseomonas sp. HF4]